MAHFIDHTDAVGAATSGGLTVLGTILGFLQTQHLPPIVIESAQLLSYCGAIMVAAVTLYKHFTKKK